MLGLGFAKQGGFIGAGVSEAYGLTLCACGELQHPTNDCEGGEGRLLNSAAQIISNMVCEKLLINAMAL
jgi:hypothetical protein